MKKRLYILGGVIFFLITAVCVNIALPLQIDKNTELSFPLSRKVQEILYYASLAPNSHNAQMWRVECLSNDRFLIFFDPLRALPAADHDNREAFLSLGAFLENFQQAGMAYGYKVSVALSDEKKVSGAKYVASVQLAKDEKFVFNADTLSSMTARHTDKRNFLLKPLPNNVLNRLLEKYTSHIRYYPKGSVGYEWLSQNVVYAMQKHVKRRDIRDELALWLRFSNSEAIAKKDGLPAEQLGITGIKKAFYYLFVDRDAATSDAFADESVLLTKRQAEACSGFFVLVPSNAQETVLYLGMIFERFWLDATRLSIALQPMSQVLGEEPFRTEVKEALELSFSPQMIFRAGLVSPYGENTKIRRQLADFVKKNTLVE